MSKKINSEKSKVTNLLRELADDIDAENSPSYALVIINKESTHYHAHVAKVSSSILNSVSYRATHLLGAMEYHKSIILEAVLQLEDSE